MKRLFTVFSILVILSLACGQSFQGSPSQADAVTDCSNAQMTIVSGTNAKLFLEDQADGTKGLLSQFKEKPDGFTVCVQYLGGPTAVNLKNDLLSKAPADFKAGEPTAFMFDSNMFADGLNEQTFGLTPWLVFGFAKVRSTVLV